MNVGLDIIPGNHCLNSFSAMIIYKFGKDPLQSGEESGKRVSLTVLQSNSSIEVCEEDGFGIPTQVPEPLLH
jgi:hypothetical protein